MPEYVYECIGNFCCGSDHTHLCGVYNQRRKAELEKAAWDNTGIAKHWRELEEGNQ